MTECNTVLITAGPYQFLATFEEAPKTVEVFRSLLPYKQKIIHTRWSGEGTWIPLGNTHFDIPWESELAFHSKLRPETWPELLSLSSELIAVLDHTSHPAAGDILLYPGGYSECELLICYGGLSFSSKMGQLAANHFLTIVEGKENLRALGELVLWKGAQDVMFELADDTK